RHVCERFEFLPQRRQRTLEVDAFERLRKLGVVGRHERVTDLLETAPRESDPLLGRELGKLRTKQPAQDIGAFLEGLWLWQLADIVLDANEAARLDHRSDIVEDDT